MARKKKPLPLLENVTITDYAAEGKSLARVDDMVVFVPWAVPGDVCDLQVHRKKHSFMEAEVARYVEKSPRRTEPFCQHFGVCGGCKWQQIPYDEQLRMKQQQVYDQLTRIGKIQLSEVRPILGSVKTREYRNKLDFGCANKRYLTKQQIEKQNLPLPLDRSYEPETMEEQVICYADKFYSKSHIELERTVVETAQSLEKFGPEGVRKFLKWVDLFE